jgi:hypothetical protein
VFSTMLSSKRIAPMALLRAHGGLVAGEDGVLSLRDPASVTWSEAMNGISCD